MSTKFNDEEVLSSVEDETMRSRVRALLEDPPAHRTALVKHVHAATKAGNMSAYFNTLYRMLFPRESLSSKRFFNFGLSFFRHNYWTNVDKRTSGKAWPETREKSTSDHIDVLWDMCAKLPVEVDDNVAEAAYACHVIEHAWDPEVDYFMRDVFRILKPGGVFRVVAPDIDLGLRAARTGDISYYAFSQFLRGSPHRERALGISNERYPIEYWVLEQCSLLTEARNPFHLSPLECKSWLWQSEDVYSTLTLASRLSDRDLNEKLGRHVNWFNAEKAQRMLRAAGFSQVVVSGYGQSLCPVMRDTRFFDTTRPDMSFYVDAIK